MHAKSISFPHDVTPLSADLAGRWRKYWGDPKAERDRAIEEGVWRRTQSPLNATESGWSTDLQHRRRLVHYRLKYEVSDRDTLQLGSFYLYLSLTGLTEEVSEHIDHLQTLLRRHWSKEGILWVSGDLEMQIDHFPMHPQDAASNRSQPSRFATMDVTCKSRGLEIPYAVRMRPWEVLAGGMRIKDTRGPAIYVDNLDSILDFLPFQIELGCGPSIEAGIPPLHRLHEIYRVTQRDGDGPSGVHAFTLRPRDDTLLTELISRPRDKFREFTEMHVAMLNAEPTPAFDALDAMYRSGAAVGPVITNNFDLMGARLGLAECFMKRFDERIPDLPILPECRSLLVVGSHADRRAVQKRFRARGVPVFYLDPEGFVDANGKFRPYPLEGIQAGDYVCNAPASIELPRLAASVISNATGGPYHED